MNTPKVLQLNPKLKNLFLLFSLSVMLALRVPAQNIPDFKIFVSADTASELKFNDKVTGWEFNEDNGFVNYDVSLSDDYSMKLTAKKATAEIMHLMVTEGKRTHKFVLLYREGADGFDLTHDYSDLIQLAKLIKDNKERKNQDQKIAGLLFDADKAFESGQLEPAKEKYKEILQLDADNSNAKKQLAAVDAMLDEKTKTAQKKSDETFNALVQKANTAFSSKKYEEALMAYLEAQKLRPDDAYLKSQVILMNKKTEEEKLAETNRKKDSLYNGYLADADKALYDKIYEEAINKYNQALVVKPGDAVATGRLKTAENMKAGFEQKTENEKMEALYRSNIDAADKAYLDKAYEEAKLAYMKALNTKQNDKYALDQLKKIDKALESEEEQRIKEQKNKETAELYASIIRFADSAFSMQIWDVAKDAYVKSLQLIDKPYARQQIAAADQKINATKKAQFAINQQKEKDSIAAEKYNALIKKADSDFDQQQYNTARDQYKKALNIKYDQYAAGRLADTEKILADILARTEAEKESIAKEKEAIKKYNILIAKAKVAYINNDYVIAQQAYTEASELKPAEEEPKHMLADINHKLASMMQAKDIQDKYDSLTSKADLAIANNDYNAALEGYKEALLIKPGEAYYLQKQINFLQRQLTVKDSIIVEEKKAEDRRQRFKEGMDAYNKGRSYLKEMKYEDALSAFQKFLDLIPDTLGLNTNQYNQQGLIDFAKSKVKDLRDYLLRQQIKDSADKAENMIPKPVVTDTVNQKSSGFIIYAPPQHKIKNVSSDENKVQNFHAGFNCGMKEQQVYVINHYDAVARPTVNFNLPEKIFTIHTKTAGAIS
jgi:tetratricopeptide (TPR) repeat protein